MSSFATSKCYSPKEMGRTTSKLQICRTVSSPDMISGQVCKYEPRPTRTSGSKIAFGAPRVCCSRDEMMILKWRTGLLFVHSLDFVFLDFLQKDRS
jgi:hypothetical protein